MGNMRIQQQNDASGNRFTEHLSDIVNGKIVIDESTQCITLPTNFCKITATTNELIDESFSKYSTKLCRLISGYISIQNGIPGDMTTYK